jgi:hypothetical protein
LTSQLVFSYLIFPSLSIWLFSLLSSAHVRKRKSSNENNKRSSTSTHLSTTQISSVSSSGSIFRSDASLLAPSSFVAGNDNQFEIFLKAKAEEVNLRISSENINTIVNTLQTAGITCKEQFEELRSSDIDEVLDTSSTPLTIATKANIRALHRVCLRNATSTSSGGNISEVEELRHQLAKLKSVNVDVDNIIDIQCGSPALRAPEPGQFHVFLTHTWNKDALGRDTHARVGRIQSYLKSRGVIAWFDEERMQGSIRRIMTKGINDSLAMVVFITKAYLDKVNGDDDGDNCRYEFTYGVEQKRPQNMVIELYYIFIIAFCCIS